MNKLGIVLGVAALATLVGCKDADYKSRRLSTQDEVKVADTPPAEVTSAAEQPAEASPAESAQANESVAEEKGSVVEKEKPVEPEYTIYIVQRGDFLGRIAQKYNLKVADIKALNEMKSDKIKLGQKIKLPGKIEVGEQTVPAGAFAETKKPQATKEVKPYQGEMEEYVVKSGDTLGGIAYGRGIKIRQLKQLNGLKGDSLRVGQKLKVPVSKATPPVKKVESAKPVEPAATDEQPMETVEPAAEAVAPAVPVEATDATTAEVVQPLTYVVREGEDIIGISVDWGVSAAAICELNNLGENDALTPGQVIKLPPEAQK